MARDGSGTYSNPYSNFVNGTVISSDEADANNAAIATALTQSIAVDGQTTITANLPMNSKKFTGLAAGTAATDSLTLGQAQAQAFAWGGTAGGSADAITIAPTPAITAYAVGQKFFWIASGSANTGAATIAISGLTAIAMQDGGAALAAGVHAAGKVYMGVLNTTSTCQIMRVQSSGDPLVISGLTVNGTADITGTTTVVALTASGLVTAGANVDMNGTELILDADADTSITADTDDTIDIRIAGADDFQFTANTFTAQSGSTIAAQALTATTVTASDIVTANASIDLNGTELILDADADTSITADTDDRIDFKIGGTDLFAMSTVGLAGPLTDSISAGSTQTQGGATAITTEVARVTVSGTDGDGVKLPTAVAGQKILIINDDAAQTIKIWPNTSDAIDGGSADAVDANVLGPGLSREYIAVDATNWYSASVLISQAAASLLDDATVAAMATTLGLGTSDNVDFNNLALRGYKVNHFFVDLQNDAGTLKHIIGGQSFAALAAYDDAINSPSITATATPTGTDASTAFATGAKISTDLSSTILLDTADITVSGQLIFMASIMRNSCGTALNVWPYFYSNSVNGSTRTRMGLLFTNATTAAEYALNTSNIASGKRIAVEVLALAPDYA
jgi:hypothetical protein